MTVATANILYETQFLVRFYTLRDNGNIQFGGHGNNRFSNDLIGRFRDNVLNEGSVYLDRVQRQLRQMVE